MREVFLQSNNGEFSNDVESRVDFNLSTEVRLLPNENLVKDFSLSNQYNKERDECERFRLILGINPICSNVLYNAKTEIVINEGSSDSVVLCDCIDGGSINKQEFANNAINTIEDINYLDAIRNTEYSHPNLGNFTYHCGYDIFNNHMLRNKSYVHVNKIATSETENDGKSYNTIGDFLRDKNGKIIQQDINISKDKNGEKTKMHLYRVDSLLSMRQAFIERCEERDGWWGFINPTNVNIPNSDNTNYLINRLINNKSACDFIDLYPDRSLYSFIPKYNSFRNRLEKNWDYCITYPFENDYEKINDICGGKKSSIKVKFLKKNNINGIEILECCSYFKHNLTRGDYIKIYFYDNNQFQSYEKLVKITSIGDSIGDNKERVFNINFNDINPIYTFIKEKDNEGEKGDNGVQGPQGVQGSQGAAGIDSGEFFFKKVSNGNECQYYFRKFKKLKTIEGSNLKSDINKVAFGKNIYGDDIAQIIFTDDININGLVDNNNRPLSKVYFTVIKRNAGHNIWYEKYELNEDGKIKTDSPKNSEKIEYSHCFGKVTSGLDFSGMKEEPFDYNVHRLHNLDFLDKLEKVLLSNKEEIKIGKLSINEKNNVSIGVTVGETEKTIDLSGTTSDEVRTFLMWGDSVLKIPKTLEDNITIEDFEIFYGDVVEYDVTRCKETIISNVYHRVNTAQRETFDICYRDIYQDKLEYDDYDKEVQGKDFTVKTYHLNDVESSISEKENDSIDSLSQGKNLIFANIMPEGNFYNPHTQIDLKSEDSIISEAPAKLINYGEDKFNYDLEKCEVTIKSPTDYGFYKGDYIAFYNTNINNTIWGEIVKVDDNVILTIKLNEIDCKNISKESFIGSMRILKAYWSTNNVPIYAELSQKNRKFMWRKLLGQSELRQNDPLYEMTFANGRLYIEKNINFFLRRQDPFGKYGLSRPITSIIGKQYTCPTDDYAIQGSKQIDVTGVLYSINNYDNCY